MDKNTIFAKTKEGEAAVRQRTRLVQRNLRNILIMVDGCSTVADLAKRFGGDEAVVNRSLAELVRKGYIVDVLQDHFALPVIDASRRPSEPQHEEVPLLTALAQAPAAAPAEPETSGTAQPPPPAEQAAPASDPWMPELQPEPTGRAGMSSFRALIERVKEKLSGMRSQPGRELRSEDIDKAILKPIRQDRRAALGWPLLTLISLAGIVSALALATLLFPYERYVSDIEQQASEALHDPVRIKRIGFAFLPRPSITLEGVEVGKDRYLTVGAIRAEPDLLSLFDDPKVLRELQLDRVVVRNSGIGRIAQWGGGATAKQVVVQHASLSDLSVEAGKTTLDGIGGEVQMSAGGTLETIKLHNPDSSLKFDARPEGGAFRIAVSGSAWKAPFPPALAFDHLEAQGQFNASGLSLTGIDGRLYDGLLTGSGSLGWSDGTVLAGDLELKHLNLAKLLPALNQDLAGEGEVSGRVHLESNAAAPGGLVGSLRATAGFDARRGAVKGFDLGEAVRNSGRSPTRGGITRFEQFSGNLLLEQQAYRLNNLRISAGPMKSSGYLNIGKDQRLNGVMEVEFKSSASQIKAPIAIGGTVKEPLLMLTRGGAAAGAKAMPPAEGPAGKQ